MAIAEPRSGDAAVLGWVFGLICVGAGVAALLPEYRRARLEAERIAAEMPRWNVALTRWQKLYYCSRDDGVFDPEEQVFVPVEKVTGYLYRGQGKAITLPPNGITPDRQRWRRREVPGGALSLVGLILAALVIFPMLITRCMR